MWIRKIKINNFKSLVDFEIDLAKFNCLIGLNGSGKSTVLQAIDFLAQLVRGDMKGWLKKRRWRPDELTSRLTNSNKIHFSVDFARAENHEFLRWTGEYDIVENQCVKEFVETKDDRFGVEGGKLVMLSKSTDLPDLNFSANFRVFWRYQGSIFSSFTAAYPFWIRLKSFGFSHYLKNTRSFDMLSPYLLRRRTKERPYSIGAGGEDFSAYLFDMGREKRDRLLARLQLVYPQLARINVDALATGRKQFKIEERFGAKAVTTEARHVNDGLLRLTALLAMLESNQCFLLFDELENGINPELVKFVIEALTQTKQQIMVTTHSPMILNFLEDDVARESVIYLDKRNDGSTRATQFFKIPSLDRKLSVMGPGEAFVDTDLLHLGEEIDRMAESG